MASMLFILIGALCVSTCESFITIRDGKAQQNETVPLKHQPFIKLPKLAEPLNYYSLLRIHPLEKVFDGKITIRLRSLSNGTRISLHSRDLVFEKYSIDGNSSSDKSLKITKVVNDDARDQATFKLSRPLITGNIYHLTIHYKGKFRNPEKFGMYSYTSCPATETMSTVLPAVLTQFECNFARTVFPLFDEPSYKAKWKLTIQHPSTYRARSNGAIEQTDVIGPNQVATHFAETNMISSYLVAISLEPIIYYMTKQIHAVTKFGKTKIEYAFPACLAHAVPLARLQHAVKRIEEYTEYFDIDMNLKKLDFVLGEHEFGGMENSGMVTVNQEWDEDWEQLDNHEISHQWTGNLVTVGDWAEFWAQEGLTMFMESMTSGDHPERDRNEYLKAFVLSFSLLSKNLSMVNEVMPSTGRVYDKGSQLFHFIISVMGRETFRNALRMYMKQFAYKSTTWAGDFLPQFEKAWPEAPQHPKFIRFLRDAPNMEETITFHVNAVDKEWIVKMKENSDGSYEIPIMVRSVTDSSNRIFWMQTDEGELRIPTSETLFFDLDFTGFYVFEYEKSTFERMDDVALKATDKQKACTAIRRLLFDEYRVEVQQPSMKVGHDLRFNPQLKSIVRCPAELLVYFEDN